MKLIELIFGPIDTNAFLMIDEDRKEALLIDAPAGVWRDVQLQLLDYDAKLVGILLTHGHWDHIADAEIIRQATGAWVYAHPGDRNWLEHPGLMAVAIPQGLDIQAVKVDHWLEDEQTLMLLGKNIEVRYVPGHSPGNVAYYFPALKKAFTGDALFAGTIGRTDLPGGNFDRLEQSIQTQLYTLPDDTVIYPGHGPATTVKEEKKSNAFVRAVQE
ncbi:MAG: hypothetical protein B7X06_02985 [Verrucomicrobia bacterium 21-51-4]|nr:MAG: hypothetical protein B7X06_02985 [Verrucomicrobia bacterium 21-51-4]HQU09289.1 MBL fold metallo-hydrolase [Opitutales bacterium]